MKRTFKKEYVLKHKGCYTSAQVEALPFNSNDEITLHELFKSLPIKDFSWFLLRKCDLTIKQKKLFSLHCAKQVLPIFEKQHPNNNTVRQCIETIEGYINGVVPLDVLNEKRHDAYAAYAAYAADAAAYAAYAADAAAYAAYAAAADADAAAYAAYAAAADAYAAAYKKAIWNFTKTL